MSIDDKKLIALADGELEPGERAEVERAVAADPALRERFEAHRRVRAQLSAAFDPVLDEPVPAHLRQILALPEEEAAPAAAAANVVSFQEKRAARWSVREWGAMAASLAAGLVIAFGVSRMNAPMIATTADGMSARGALARALDVQLAADADSAVRIGLSFRDQDGEYCRTFELTTHDTAGLACHDGEAWRVQMTAAHESGGELRQAGGAAEVLAAVEARIAGEPLDAEAETRARDAGWR